MKTGKAQNGDRIGVPFPEGPAPGDGQSVRLSRRYLLTLIAVAMMILVAGVALRPKRNPAPSVSEAERTRRQTLALRQEIEKRTQYSASRARDLLPLVRQLQTKANPAMGSAPRSGDRLLIVAPSGGEEVIWVETAYSATVAATCHGAPVQELAVTAPLSRALAQAVAFDSYNEPVALAHDCGNRVILLTYPDYRGMEISALLHRLRSEAGVEVQITAQGARVRSLDDESELLRSGIEPGDVIAGVNGNPVKSAAGLKPLLQRTQPAQLQLERNGKQITAAIGSKASSSGVEWRTAERPASVASVVPGSTGDKWGLQAGDVVLRAGSNQRPRVRDVESILESGGGPLVVQRASLHVLLEKTQ